MSPEFERELIPGLSPPQDTLYQKFKAYDARHPEVFQAIYDRCLVLYSKGERYISMRDLFGDLRKIMPILGEKYGLNNSWTSFYSDRVIEKDPRFTTVFKRRVRAHGKMKLVYTK